MVHLLGGGVHAHAVRAGQLVRAQQEAAEATAHVDEGLAARQLQLAAHVVALVALRLLQGARVPGPVRAGVEQERIVEPEAVEGIGQRVVRLGILLGAAVVAVGAAQLVQAVADPVEQVRLGFEPAVERRAHQRAEAALDVERAVEIGLGERQMAAQGGMAQHHGPAQHDAEGGRARRRAEAAQRAIAPLHLEGGVDVARQALEQRGADAFSDATRLIPPHTRPACTAHFARPEPAAKCSRSRRLAASPRPCDGGWCVLCRRRAAAAAVA
jgi:hypothetical protein